MLAPALDFKHTVTERFLRYVVIDTQSDPDSPTTPSTEKQKNLGRLLVAELQAMGISDAHLDPHGYVYATIPANTDKTVPVICFCSHMDTSPDCTGKNVKPQVVKNYRGGDIVLPADASQVIRPAEHEALADQIGNDIITTDGTTLLGADNKAGLAEIMGAAHFLITNPQVKHGTIKILFTPDEEIGRGVDKVDLKKLGADFGYTMDGETAGHIEDETFSADGASIIIEGVATHPGFAKGKMEHAIKIAAAIVDRLPKDTCSPETTEGKEGFLHPVAISGRAGERADRLHRARFHRGWPEAEGIAAGRHREGRHEGLSALDLPHGGQAAVPQHEGCDRSPPADRGLCDRGDRARRSHAGEDLDPRRHGRLAAVLYGTALPEHLRRRARVPFAARMGQPAGHGEGRADHRAPGDDLGREGLIRPARSRSRSRRAAAPHRP
ncbi:peptidase T [Bradyrhizobium sp. USDA 4506]